MELLSSKPGVAAYILNSKSGLLCGDEFENEVLRHEERADQAVDELPMPTKAQTTLDSRVDRSVSK